MNIVTTLQPRNKILERGGPEGGWGGESVAYNLTHWSRFLQEVCLSNLNKFVIKMSAFKLTMTVAQTTPLHSFFKFIVPATNYRHFSQNLKTLKVFGIIKSKYLICSYTHA